LYIVSSSKNENETTKQDRKDSRNVTKAKKKEKLIEYNQSKKCTQCNV